MKNVRKASFFLLLDTAIVLILEAIPFGAVLIFGTPDGESIRQTFSYFDLTPYGYANVGPFTTAVLTCALFIMATVCLISGKEAFLKVTCAVSLVTFAISLTPLIFGVRYFTLTALAISVLLLIQFIISALQLKK